MGNETYQVQLFDGRSAMRESGYMDNGEWKKISDPATSESYFILHFRFHNNHKIPLLVLVATEFQFSFVISFKC
jgi:hypothetical protein